MLRIQCAAAPTQSTWPSFLSDCVFAHNSSLQASLLETPFQLMHSFSPRLPAHAQLGIPPLIPGLPLDPGTPNPRLAPAHANLQQAQARQKFHYDKHRRPASFSPGDLVLVRDLAPTPGLCKKLCPQFRGPFSVLSKESDVNYVVKIADTGARQHSTVHVANIRRYIPRRPLQLLCSPATLSSLPDISRLPSTRHAYQRARARHRRTASPPQVNGDTPGTLQPLPTAINDQSRPSTSFSGLDNSISTALPDTPGILSPLAPAFQPRRPTFPTLMDVTFPDSFLTQLQDFQLRIHPASSSSSDRST